MRPECTQCGNYLLPCTKTATGIHPEVKDATTGKPVRLDDPRHPFYGDPSEGFGYTPGEDARPRRHHA